MVFSPLAGRHGHRPGALAFGRAFVLESQVEMRAPGLGTLAPGGGFALLTGAFFEILDFFCDRH
ncbi:hypothetical protein ASD39_18920 [Sphingomonas sp. Root50]|nr:hypothetical protein ASD17_16055 [Sphingomonas sp. Root1294]KQY72035.1 hypothetical protein ASD39_18920 [Sphingomonas sp. Root50]KRB94696.1 hypothetical protein ASE22_01835 [Sphingomonas sp. Root720]